MATTPSTIVVFTEDKVNFPTKWVIVLMKQLCQYGVKYMPVNGSRVFISLSYSSRTATLKRKFGNLPVRYMRVEHLDNTRIEGGKRKFYLQPPTLLLDDDDDDDDNDSDNGGSNDNVNQDGGHFNTKKRLGHQLKKKQSAETIPSEAAAATASSQPQQQ
nr:unnamed protein product [Callosobruchus chinensis]